MLGIGYDEGLDASYRILKSYFVCHLFCSSSYFKLKAECWIVKSTQGGTVRLPIITTREITTPEFENFGVESLKVICYRNSRGV